MRKIIHVDMDAFYASVEQREDPGLRGRPVAVGHSGPRGVVAAASYEARRFGVRSALPSAVARRLCPELIFVEANFPLYKQVSREIMDILRSYTPLVEPLSLDEAYMDVTENSFRMKSASQLGAFIKEHIYAATLLTASCGVSYNKFLAKIASDIDKPNGLYVITPSQAQHFLEGLPIEKFYGIGKVTADKMHRLGIFNGGDLKKQSRKQLTTYFGKNGLDYYNYARGIDERPVKPERIRRSVGTERTFATDLTIEQIVTLKLEETASELERRVANAGFIGRTLTVKVKYTDFRTITRSSTRQQPYSSATEISTAARELLLGITAEEKKIRLFGITISNSTVTGQRIRNNYRSICR